MFPALDTRNVPNAQGQSASLNGVALEALVAKILTGYGYAMLATIPPHQTAPFFVQQHREKGRFQSIYKKEMKIDFFVFHPEKYPNGLLLECKRQTTGGSVDQKLPYSVLSLKGHGVPAILLLDGQGPVPEAIDWCKAQQDETFIFIHGISEFNKYAKRGLF